MSWTNQILDWKFYNNTALQWIVGVGAFVILYLLFLTCRKLLCRWLKHSHSDSSVFDWRKLLLQLVQRTHAFVLLVVALYIGAQALDLNKKPDKFLFSTFIIFVLIQVAIWVQVILAVFLDRLISRRMKQDASSVPVLSLVGFFVRLLLWVLVGVLILDNLGFNVTALVAGLGVGGIAVALAAQKILEDLFASLSIVLDKPFVHGDSIVIGEMNGTVEKIGIKTTRLRSLSGELLIFSNSDLLQSRIRNYKRMRERRIEFKLGIIYETDSEKIKKVPQIIKQAIEAQPQTRFDRSHFITFRDHDLEIVSVYFVLTPDYIKYCDIQQAINLQIIHEFKKEGIEFSYPTQRQYIRPGDAVEKAS